MNIRRFPSAVEYSSAYQVDLRRAIAEIDLQRRLGHWPLEQLVWHARTLYRDVWAAELERP
jgi:hypothetical protein